MIANLTKKKVFTIFLIILMLANIVTAIVIFSDIQIIQAPEINMQLKVVDITAEDLSLDIEMDVNNPNSFEISIEDFDILSMTDNEDIISEIQIEGGSILSGKTKRFSVSDEIQFNKDSDFKILNSKITGKIGVNFLGFIKKTIPIELNVKTSVEELIKNINIPEMDLEFIFDDLTDDGLEFTAGINVYNPNNVGVTIEELTLHAINDFEEEVGSFKISGGNIKPNDESYFTSSGVLLYDLIDSKKLILRLSGDASLNIAGMNKKLSLSTEISVILPDIQEFIFQNENVRFYIPVQFKMTLKGILASVGFKYYNPSNITLIARNINCSIYRVDEDEKTNLGIQPMDSCIIDPKEEVCVKTQILIPYRKYLKAGNRRILPDWIVLTIEGDFAIAGTRQAFPISLNAYVNPNIFKNKEFKE